jgi:hypothetical protein
MQIPLLYHVFQQYNQENFSNPNNERKIPLSVILYYLFIVYISILVSVYATVLAWEKAQGSFFTKLNYAVIGNVFGVFYIIYHFLKYNSLQ